MFETHLREVVSKVARSPGVVHQAEKLLDCTHVLKAASMLTFCSTCSIVPPWGCCLRNLIWICRIVQTHVVCGVLIWVRWIVLLHYCTKSWVRVNFIVWCIERMCLVFALYGLSQSGTSYVWVSVSFCCMS